MTRNRVVGQILSAKSALIPLRRTYGGLSSLFSPSIRKSEAFFSVEFSQELGNNFVEWQEIINRSLFHLLANLYYKIDGYEARNLIVDKNRPYGAFTVVVAITLENQSLLEPILVTLD